MLSDMPMYGDVTVVESLKGTLLAVADAAAAVVVIFVVVVVVVVVVLRPV